MKKYSLIALIVFYFLAGINHFLMPSFYIPLIPDYLEYPIALNYISGIIEILLGLLLLSTNYRKFASIGIILLLISFVPAHLHFIQSGNCFGEFFCIPSFISWLRLLVIHPILMYWAWSQRDNQLNIL